MVAAIAPDLKPLSVKFSSAQIEWLDRAADSLHVPRSQVIRFVVDVARQSGLQFSPAAANPSFEQTVQQAMAAGGIA